jgi:hypothetical protein
MKAHRDFLNVPCVLFFLFLVVKFALLYAVTLGLNGIIIFSVVFFLLSLFFLNVAKRTIHREKETIFCVISSVLLYSSIFGTLNIIGVFSFTPLSFMFVLFFFAFLLLEGGEFFKTLIHVSLILLALLGLIQNTKMSNLISSSFIVFGVVLAIVTYYLGINAQSFEKKSYISLLFGWAILLSAERVIYMLWSIP